MRRIEGEIIRDAILTVSGQLDRTIGGRSVPIHLTKFTSGRGRPASGPLDGDGRRSIYLAVRRNFHSPWMLVFDTPIPLGPVGRRNKSNVPALPLALLNDPFVIEQARHWAEKILAEEGDSPNRIVNGFYRDAFARSPSEDERRVAIEFLSTLAAERNLDDGQWKKNVDLWGRLRTCPAKYQRIYLPAVNETIIKETLRSPSRCTPATKSLPCRPVVGICSVARRPDSVP